MTTILFRCPACDTHCIRRLGQSHQVLAFANQLPVLTSCWICRSETLVAPDDGKVPATGIFDSIANHSLRIAEACGRRADAAADADAQSLLREFQSYWRRVGYRMDRDHVIALVSGKAARYPASPARRLTVTSS
jgi:hypothetical protein